MDTKAIGKTVELLRACNTMSIATCDGSIPWAASVFFVADPEYNLFFISSESSRHCVNTSVNPVAAVTINKDHDDWLTICGLQIEGRVSVVPKRFQKSTLESYLEKFPNIKSLRASPKNDQERLIAQRILGSDFYQLQPTRIRLIDNESGFGSKSELPLDT